MTFFGLARSARSFFVHAFVQYGAGADRWKPVVETKWFNTACWIVIVIGAVGWAAFLFWND